MAIRQTLCSLSIVVSLTLPATAQVVDPSYCKQIVTYIKQYGRAAVLKDARRRGHSEELIATVIARCRL